MAGAQDDWLALAELAREHPIAVRFIEKMPIGLGQGGTPCTEEEISAVLEAAFGPLTPDGTIRGNGPAHYASLPGFRGRIGFISAVSHAFCDRCNRVRLTASGYLKTCLQYEVGADLAALLRQPDEAIRAAIIEAIGRKPASHQFSAAAVPDGETRIMSQIGG